MKPLAIAVSAGLLLVCGCSRNVENKEAVRKAILDHLADRGMNVQAMQVDIVSVTFRQNEADASVSFRTTGAQGGPGMNMNYTLEKKGSAWAVKARADSGGSPHGAAGQMPGSMPPEHPDIGAKQPAETKK